MKIRVVKTASKANAVQVVQYQNNKRVILQHNGSAHNDEELNELILMAEEWSGKNGFQISPKLQELIVYAGTLETYESCNEVLEKFIDVSVSSAQVHRVTNLYDLEVGKTLNDEVVLTPCKKDEVLYAMADGSMIFTREDDWKEVKVGRIFKSSDCIHADEKRGWISNSQYVAHLVGCKQFTQQMEKLLDNYTQQKQQVVFISDGAKWIRNWVEHAYPNAILILDFFHAMEYLCHFAKAHFADENKKHKWIEAQKELLLKSQVGQVLTTVKKMKSTCKEATALIDYFESNKDRMDYAYYQTIGTGIIGSGAIEAAHQTVIQKRIKLSGQRWSLQGAQNMLNLRVTKKNNQWGKIVQLTKSEFTKKAA